MAAPVPSDYTSFLAAQLDPKYTEAFHRKRSVLAKIYKPRRNAWQGQSVAITTKTAPRNGSQVGRMGHAFYEQTNPTNAQQSIGLTNILRIQGPVKVNWETAAFVAGGGNQDAIIDHMTEAVDDCKDDLSWTRDLLFACDEYLTRAIISGVYDTDGSGYTPGAADAILTIRRSGTTVIGGIGRFRVGDICALRAAAAVGTGNVRVYFKVLEIRAAYTDSNLTLQDVLKVTTTGVTQTSLPNASTACVNSADGNFNNAASGDYVSSMAHASAAGVGVGGYGIDAWEAGTKTIFGIDQTTFGNGWYKTQVQNAGGAALSLGVLDSMLASATHTMPLREMGGSVRMHQDQFRHLRALAEAKENVIRKATSADREAGEIVQGYTDWVYLWPERSLMLLVDPMQAPSVIDVIAADAWEAYPRDLDSNWVTMNDSIWNAITSSGRAGVEYEANWVEYDVYNNRRPDHGFRVTNLAVPAYMT